MGGAVGFLYAGSFPDDVEKLISLDIASPTVRHTESVVNLTGISIDRYVSPIFSCLVLRNVTVGYRFFKNGILISDF